MDPKFVLHLRLVRVQQHLTTNNYQHVSRILQTTRIQMCKLCNRDPHMAFIRNVLGCADRYLKMRDFDNLNSCINVVRMSLA
jgi:hypothetical protein